MDRGFFVKIGYLFIKILVEDINDNKFIFIFFSEVNWFIIVLLLIVQNIVVVILIVSDGDIDVNVQLRYYIDDQNMIEIFVINSVIGEVIVVCVFDFDDFGLYVFKVKV